MKKEELKGLKPKFKLSAINLSGNSPHFDFSKIQLYLEKPKNSTSPLTNQKDTIQTKTKLSPTQNFNL
jgi:hypothetical protein